MDVELPRLKVAAKSGNEPFSSRGAELEFTLLDFWRWSVSDLASNATRGRLAEFIVAKALEICTDQIRDEWAAHDLTSPEGVKIEVKSAAYLQSWYQSDYSLIQFSVRKSRAWNPQTNCQDSEVRRQADVYVFALLDHKDKATLDPMNLDQWKFYVLPTTTLDGRDASQHSITLKTLNQLCGGPVCFHDLPPLVSKSVRNPPRGNQEHEHQHP